MAKTVTGEPFDQLAADQAAIDQLAGELERKIRARNRRVVAAVDDGWPQDRVAAALGRAKSTVTKILATTTGTDSDPLEP